MSSTPNRLKHLTPVIDPDDLGEAAEGTSTAADHRHAVSDAEVADLRAEKLASIKKAVETGVYDSDELLEKAMERMKAAIESGNKPQ